MIINIHKNTKFSLTSIEIKKHLQFNISKNIFFLNYAIFFKRRQIDNDYK